MDVSTPVAIGGWRRVGAWSLYDFANSPFSTIMTTVGFPLFFMNVVAPGRGASLAWGLLYGLSMTAAALLSPGLGAWSDSLGRRKPFLVAFTLISVVGTALCGLLDAGMVVEAFVFFGVANLSFACATVFYNALLVKIAPPERLNAVSGIGWATGYIGGLLGLLLALPLYRGGVVRGNLADVRLSFILVALIFLVFSVPLFLMKEKAAVEGRALRKGLSDAYGRVWKTLKEMSRYKGFFLFLAADFFLNDGLSTIIIFAGPFARNVLGITTKDIFLLFIALNVVAAVGALVLGRVAGSWGSLKTLLVLAVFWMAISAALATCSSRVAFYVVSGFAGLLLGATQSVARGFAAELAPAELQGEFFGFFGMTGKLAALIGPVLFGVSSTLAGTMRAGAWSILPLFITGFVLLLMARRALHSRPHGVPSRPEVENPHH